MFTGAGAAWSGCCFGSRAEAGMTDRKADARKTFFGMPGMYLGLRVKTRPEANAEPTEAQDLPGVIPVTIPEIRELGEVEPLPRRPTPPPVELRRPRGGRWVVVVTAILGVAGGILVASLIRLVLVEKTPVESAAVVAPQPAPPSRGPAARAPIKEAKAPSPSTETTKAAVTETPRP